MRSPATRATCSRRVEDLGLLLVELLLRQDAALLELPELLQLGESLVVEAAGGLGLAFVLVGRVLFLDACATFADRVSRSAHRGGAEQRPAPSSEHGSSPSPPQAVAGTLPCSASWSSSSVCFDSDDLSTVPPNLLSAATALSGVTFSTTRNSAEVPGFSISRTCSWNSRSMPDFSSLPISAPNPAPSAIPKIGTKNSMPKRSPQKPPHVAPPATWWWLVMTLYLPCLSQTIAAIASGWMISSCARFSASDAAWIAV